MQRSQRHNSLSLALHSPTTSSHRYTFLHWVNLVTLTIHFRCKTKKYHFTNGKAAAISRRDPPHRHSSRRYGKKQKKKKHVKKAKTTSPKVRRQKTQFPRLPTQLGTRLSNRAFVENVKNAKRNWKNVPTRTASQSTNIYEWENEKRQKGGKKAVNNCNWSIKWEKREIREGETRKSDKLHKRAPRSFLPPLSLFLGHRHTYTRKRYLGFVREGKERDGR